MDYVPLSSSLRPYGTHKQVLYSDANLGVAEALPASGEIKKAWLLRLRASCLDPLDAVVHYRLAILYRKFGSSAKADREFKEFERLKKLGRSLRDSYQEMRSWPNGKMQMGKGIPQWDASDKQRSLSLIHKVTLSCGSELMIG